MNEELKAYLKDYYEDWCNYGLTSDSIYNILEYVFKMYENSLK